MIHPTEFRPNDFVTERQFDRFWSQVEVAGPDDCWEWEGGKFAAGYGAFGIGDARSQTRRMVGAHRLAFFFAHGRWPNVCRHSCDNRPCCNPAHLIDGTHADNMKDSLKRGQRGASRNTQSMTPADFRSIRKAIGMTQGQLAARMKVTTRAVQLWEAGDRTIPEPMALLVKYISDDEAES